MRLRADSPTRLADLPVWIAIASLLGVLAWKVVLVRSSPPSLVASELLAPPSAAEPDSGRLVLVVAAGDSAVEPGPVQAARRAHPRRSLHVERVPWASPDDPSSRQGRMAALVRAYGHTELPVLLTVSREGHVVRVQSLAGVEAPASLSRKQ